MWQRGCDCVTTSERAHGIEASPAYLNSPVRHIREGGGALRRRLEGPDAVVDFPVLEELKALGANDYLILPLRRDGARSSFISLATDRPGGFSAGHLAAIEGLAPVIALISELFSARRMTDDLLTVYLGHDAARRVLEGAIRRGTGEAIRAVLWTCDLNGFTALSDATEPAELIGLLDRYFEAMADPVEAKGGEILKFIGDAILAIFRPKEGGEAEAARLALEAAEEALANLAALNQARQAEGKAALVTKIALHVGDMVYGNVGAADRLDFTVIGPAVNTVARVQAQCGILGEPVLATREFARLLPGALIARGAHSLRGLSAPTELFALEPAARPAAQVRP
jgi:adenylate cyclase